MPTITYNLDSSPKMIGLSGYGATVQNLSGFAVRANGTSVGAGATLDIADGVKTLLLEGPSGAVVNVTVPDVSGLSGNVIQIGTIPAPLDLYRLLCSVAQTFGVTYYDALNNQIGASTILAVNVGGSTPVALPNVPTGAVLVRLVHDNASSVTLYYATTDVTSLISDFTTNYLRYPRKLVTAVVGTSLGA